MSPSLSELPLLKFLFFDRKWVPEYLCIWFFASSKHCRHRKCYSFDQELRCVTTLILTAPSLHTYVVPRAVTEQTVSVSKWLTLIDPVSPVYPILWLKKAILQRENLPDVRKTSHWAVYIYLCAFRNWKCYRQFIPPKFLNFYHWCLTEISFTYPSQFPGMFKMNV